MRPEAPEPQTKSMRSWAREDAFLARIEEVLAAHRAAVHQANHLLPYELRKG